MSKYATIRKQLRDRIRGGELTPGDCLPPEKSLAEQFGVSYMTARRAVTGLVREGLVERRRGDGSYVRAAPSSPVDGSAGPGSEMDLQVAILIASMPRGDYRTRCLAAFENAVSGRGGSTQWHVFDKDRPAPDLVEKCNNVNGFFYVHNSVHGDAVLQQCMQQHAPVVASCYYGTLNVNRAYEDWGWALQELMEHLIDAGHRRIALAGFTLQAQRSPSAWIEARRQAFLDTARRQSLPVSEADIYFQPLDERSTSRQFDVGVSCGRHLLARPRSYTAVIGLNDKVALGVKYAAEEAGLDVPGALSIAGFDNLPEAAEAGLTTIRPAAEHDGQAAADLLADLVRNPNRNTVYQLTSRPELIVRTSTAAPPELVALAHDRNNGNRMT